MKVHEHFKKSAEQHQALSDHHNALADECEKEGMDGCAKAARACAKVHDERSMHYKAMAGDAASKAANDELEKGRSQVMPTRVSAVTPTPPGITAVPRAGQRPIAKADVDPEFADLAKVQTGDEE